MLCLESAPEDAKCLRRAVCKEC